MTLKKTPLNEVHKKLGAKMVDFGGWEMPVQYTGIIEEHTAVRTKAGLFDVSHMGEIWIEGPDSLEVVQKLVTVDVKKLLQGKISYALMCYPHGGVVDDLLVYKINQESYLLVVNASNKDKDLSWITEHAHGRVKITDKSADTAQIALQGPAALGILQELTQIDLTELSYYTWNWIEVNGIDCLVSRTGYTGEDGFEIYCEPKDIVSIWEKVLQTGGDNVQPIGLGARDTLRFEAGMPLYGHELSEDISPLEAGLGFFVHLDGDDFIGRAALQKQKDTGIPRKIIGFEMLERGIARANYEVYIGEEKIGHVTTGNYSPTLSKNIGSALIKSKYTQKDNVIEISVRGKRKKAKIITRPFYKRK